MIVRLSTYPRSARPGSRAQRSRYSEERTAARHARDAHPAHALRAATARLCDRAADPAPLQRGADRRARIAVPGARAIAAARLGDREVGRITHGTTSALLHHHRV